VWFGWRTARYGAERCRVCSGLACLHAGNLMPLSICFTPNAKVYLRRATPSTCTTFELGENSPSGVAALRRAALPAGVIFLDLVFFDRF